MLRERSLQCEKQGCALVKLGLFLGTELRRFGIADKYEWMNGWVRDREDRDDEKGCTLLCYIHAG